MALVVSYYDTQDGTATGGVARIFLFFFGKLGCTVVKEFPYSLSRRDVILVESSISL